MGLARPADTHPHPLVQLQAAQVGVFQQYRRAAEHPTGERQDKETEVFDHAIIALSFYRGFGDCIRFPV